MLGRKRKNTRVERECWYDLVSRLREWDYQWQNYLANIHDRKPMSKDEFIDRQIKLFELRDREQKSTRNILQRIRKATSRRLGGR